MSGCGVNRHEKGVMPNFLVIGAAKCGTTSVCDLLRRHPDVFMSEPKEPHYFSDPTEFDQRGAWYQSLFRDAESKKAIGEGSTSYTHPDVIALAASRIADVIPDCRLIYMVRHPLERLESDWKMRRLEGWTPASINEAVETQPSLMGHSLYWTNLREYQAHFADRQILVCFLEDFARDPDAELRRMAAHIGADPCVKLDDTHRPRNRAGSRRMDRSIARFLRDRPWFGAAKAAMPEWVLASLKAILTKRPKPSVVEWDPKVRRNVIETVRKDALTLLEFCGKQPDFWTLD